MSIEYILGPPGTGKTKTLLDMVSDALAEGTRPERIGFVSFTRRAVNEAVERAGERFNFDREEMPFFRTLHSMAFRMLNLNRDQVLKKSDYKSISNLYGFNFSAPIFDDETGLLRSADEVTRIEQLARVTCQPLQKLWNENDMEIGFKELEHFCNILTEYKKKNLLYDFTDMIINFIASMVRAPELDLLLIDEAQDLSNIQWQMVDKLTSNAVRTVIAGDDDQAIFEWSGADVQQFIRRAVHGRVLNQSYRLPQKILTLSKRLINRIESRIPKTIHHTGQAGFIDQVVSTEYLDHLENGEWLVLVRNRHHTDNVIEFCRNRGYSYDSRKDRLKNRPVINAAFAWERVRKGEVAKEKDLNTFRKMARHLDFNLPWHEAFNKIEIDEIEFLKSALRRGENLKKPRIRISTIHGAKGAECDNVLLYRDQSAATAEAAEKNKACETRVFYVGITRARKQLVLMEPQTPIYFNFERL